MAKFSLKDISIFNSVKIEEKIIMTRTLSAMLNAGLAISRALSVLERQSKNKLLKETIGQVIADVTKGSSLKEAVAKHPKVFSKLYVSMVGAGEASGTLSSSLSVVGVQMEKAHSLASKVKSAMIYPAIILSAIVVISILMLIFVVPTLTNTFNELGVQLPATTQAIVSASEFLKNHTFLALGIMITFGVLVWRGIKSKLGSKIFANLILRIPVISTIVRETYSARTARTLASLLGAGVEVLQSLEITEQVIGFKKFSDVISQAKEYVQKGEPIAKAFKENSNLYPVLVGDMIEVGEETGGVADMLGEVADFYEGEVEKKTKDLSTIVEPFLMLLIGAVVGIFALSMIGPIYSISESI